jgi:dihydroorotase
MSERSAASPAPLWLRGGRLIDPERGWDGPGDVLLYAGLVHASGDPGEVAEAAVALQIQGQAPRVVELPASQIVAPGLCDLHVHLREPGMEARETIHTGALAAARGGFTTICCMPNTQPVLDNRGVIEWVRQIAEPASARVLPIAAITKEQKGEALTEMVELAAAGAVAFSDDGKPVKSSGMMRHALNYGLIAGRPIVNHCEDPELVGQGPGQGVMNAGAVSLRLGLRGWPVSGETIMLARDLELCRATGGRYHAAHLSSAGSVELIRRAKDAGLRVTAEVTPHHLLLTESWVAGEREGILGAGVPAGRRYDTATKVNPPLRTLADTRVLLAALRDGTIDAIATDHAPHSDVEKCCSYDEAAYGISGLETALPALLALHHQHDLPLSTLIAALTSRPARCFALAERLGRPVGTLLPGAVGDVVVFDPAQPFPVQPARFASKGQNSPLAGLTLRGRVLLTVYGGRVVHEE